MADTQFRTGDSLWSLTRKLLDGFNNGFTGANGGSGGGGSAVTMADGANVTQGAKADAANTNSTGSWTVVSLLKGIWAKLNGGVAISNVAGTVTVNQAVASALQATVSGNVGGLTTVIKDTTAVSTSPAYSIGDAVGGKRTLTGALLKTNGTAILESVTILDRANQKAAMTLFIFDSNPAAATITDNSAFVFSTDDLKVIAQVSIGASDYVTTNSKAIAQKTGLGVALNGANGDGNLYAALVTTGTPTFAATTDVQLEFGLLQD